jgi:hypothetical protein
MYASTMQGRIRAASGANPSVLGGVRAWLSERLWWENRIRMMAHAASLRGGALEMADETWAGEDGRSAGRHV